MALHPGARVGPYDVVGLIGVGGMGEVYAAHDARLGRRVALKILPERFTSDPHRLERFRREAQLLAALSHPNIAAIHGLEEDGGMPALVLELVDGPTLEDLVAQGPLPVAEAVVMARQIASGLEAAHEQGIIHRDLKPANIARRADGTIKILDFGLAKVLDPACSIPAIEQPTLTAPVDGIMGTAAYMSPEQARGQPLDRRADIWAFGCIVYEILTGTRAFPGATTSDTLAAVISAEPDWARLPADLTPVLAGYLRRCLDKNPKQRVRDIGDVRLALEGAFDLTPGTATGGVSGGARKARLLLWLAAAAMLSGAAILVSWRAQRPADELPISFDLHPPAGSAFSQATMAPFPALSRDGRQLAFVAPLTSTPVLWVQTIGQGPARHLPGTEGAQFAFWSPDAQFLGFTTGSGRLQKIEASGDRAPEELCTCEALFGGSWSADDTVLFAGATGVFQVPAGGGTAQEVTHVETSRGEYSHRFPVLAPDDRHFLYLVRSSDETRRGLYLGSLDDLTMKKRLVPDDSNGAFGVGPNGQLYLFFARDPALIAQPFDAARRALVGSGVVMARPVSPGAAGRLAPFAVGGRTLVYRRSSIVPNRLVWMDRRGTRGAAVGMAGAEYAFPALSPDGARLAVARRDANTGIRNIWLLDLQRAKEEQLTDDPAGGYFPQWTTDGSKIVFGSSVEARWEIFWRWADGTRSDRSLFHLPPASADGVIGRDGWPRDLTRDEHFLLYGSNTALWVQRLDDKSQPYRLLAAGHGRVSPDGRWLAYTSVEHGEQEIYVTTFPTPTRHWRISPVGGRDPQWRNDGAELYYVAPDSTLMAADVSDAVRRGSFDKVVPKTLFRTSFSGFSLDFGSVYSPARDGSRFLIVEEIEGQELLLNVRMNWVPGGV